MADLATAGGHLLRPDRLTSGIAGAEQVVTRPGKPALPANLGWHGLIRGRRG